MGAVSWFTRLAEFVSFRYLADAGKGEASAFNSPTKSQGYTKAQLARELEPGLNALFGVALDEQEFKTMSASELKQYAKALRKVADGLEKLASDKETVDFPKYCSGLYDYMKNKKGRIYLEQMMKDLGKTKHTIRTEISHLRKAGVSVKKQYVPSTKKYKYFLEEAA